jgi:hypothetical protein
MDPAGGLHGRSNPDACSVIWDNAEASALGTAPAAVFWVALEQTGPWGRLAATQSHLDPEVGAKLDRACQDLGGRFMLIRRPGAHPDPHDGVVHRVYVASGLASQPWLLEADIADPSRLLQLPFAFLGSADMNAVQDVLPELTQSPAAVLMICGHSKRDVCCAVRGRPVAIETSSQRPGQVWECSHTGGHRFAPTGVLLPYGQTFGRLSSTSAVSALDSSTHAEVPSELLGPTHDRGRSHLDAPAQAAEAVVRHEIQEPSLLALSTTAAPQPGHEDAWECRVRHVDGRFWDVVALREPGDNRPDSCGKPSVPTWQWTVLSS